MEVERLAYPAPQGALYVVRVLARLKHLGDVPYRGSITERSQVLTDVVPESTTSHVWAPSRCQVEVEVDDLCPEPHQVGHGILEDTNDRRVCILRVDKLS